VQRNALHTRHPIAAHLAIRTIDWTITHVVLTDPSDQIYAPGDVVSLQIQASDPDGDTLTYAAAGLPTGLSIDQSTCPCR
jgi:hypothetical protein